MDPESADADNEGVSRSPAAEKVEVIFLDLCNSSFFVMSLGMIVPLEPANYTNLLLCVPARRIHFFMVISIFVSIVCFLNFRIW